MTTSITNPVAILPFCPDQTDFLCFRSPDGFAAIELNLIEGFAAFASDDKVYPYLTRVHLTNGSFYDAIESVPELVNRAAEVKRRRYDPARSEREIIKTPSPTPPPVRVPAEHATNSASGHAASSATVVPPTNNIWKKPAT